MPHTHTPLSVSREIALAPWPTRHSCLGIPGSHAQLVHSRPSWDGRSRGCRGRTTARRATTTPGPRCSTTARRAGAAATSLSATLTPSWPSRPAPTASTTPLLRAPFEASQAGAAPAPEGSGARSSSELVRALPGWFPGHAEATPRNQETTQNHETLATRSRSCRSARAVTRCTPCPAA